MYLKISEGDIMVYRYAIRPLLFAASRKDPEIAHEQALSILGRIGRRKALRQLVHRLTATRDERLEQRLLGLTFHHPVGLAAGFDKNAVALHGLAALDFSFIEAGTITPLEQLGNPRPRMFRFPADKAMINRMGFNNFGSELVGQQLAETGKLPIPLGISLGKGKDTPLEQAVEDYSRVLNRLFHYGDYFVVNVSSPNTPGLRDLQGKEHLDVLLGTLRQDLVELGWITHEGRKPLLVKIAPDLPPEALDQLVEVCCKHEVGGLIATNTTTTREGLSIHTDEAGGLSGRPLQRKAWQVVHDLRQRIPPSMPIIGVGGIFTAGDAYNMLKAGANLVQVYTGFVYEGGMIVRSINRGLLRLMEQDGVQHISELQKRYT